MSQKRRILTGITTTGTPHLGNYVGAIRPAIAASRNAGAESFYFLADYHALVKCDDPARVQRSTLEIAASWLVCGLDPEKVYFYRQSDIPEIPELTWLLTCVTAKGLLNRAHAYKAATDANRDKGDDADAGINAGLYMYPVLMAADILIFNANKVPVGRDQVQHIEMARDIGQRFNHIYGGEFFALPEAAIEENVATLPGTDGRKMSKSYDNTIPLWLPEKDLRKAILGIVTNSQAPGEAKNPDESNIFAIYQAFASAEETAAMRRAYADGIGWGDAKQKVFERVNAELAPMREKYDALIGDPAQIEDRLHAGAARARALATPFVARLRYAVGLRDLREAANQSTQEKTTRAEKPALQPVVFRDGSTFAFKVLDAKKSVLAEKSGFADPKAAMAAAREAMSNL
ncbi:MAG TPA: tryptophan--tRNA ligase [Rudaea sp.]|nr:tryptophan--tRNA ligase [Rudaea sp.]